MKKKFFIFSIIETIGGYIIVASFLAFCSFYRDIIDSGQMLKTLSKYVFNYNIVNITMFISIALLVFTVNMTKGTRNLKSIKRESTGDNQHGSSRFSTKSEKEQYYKLVKRGHEDTNGVILGYDKHQNYYVDTSDKNILVYAPPGSGKTKSILINNILYNIKVYEHTGKWSNHAIVSLKNDLHDMTISEMEKNDINVSVINLRNPLMSKKFNPMKQVNDYSTIYHNATSEKEKTKAYARAEKYSKTLASAIVKSVGDASSGGDQFFSQTSQGLISAIILLVSEYGDPEEKHLVSVFNLIIELNGLSEESTETLQKSRFKELLELAPHHRANYLAGASVSADVRTSMNVFASALSELLSFIDLEMEQMFQTSKDEFDLHQFVTTKSAVYLIVPDEDTSKHFIASLFYRLLFDMSIAV
ncbi:MAG: type IV secretory system conjugative DNA transfer family protein, partial [Erysipelotrichaceae bacterium]